MVTEYHFAGTIRAANQSPNKKSPNRLSYFTRRLNMHAITSKCSVALLTVLLGTALFQSNVLASTISVGIGAFGPGSTLTTFAGLPDGTEVNGLIVGGINFTYSL